MIFRPPPLTDDDLHVLDLIKRQKERLRYVSEERHSGGGGTGF